MTVKSEIYIIFGFDFCTGSDRRYWPKSSSSGIDKRWNSRGRASLLHQYAVWIWSEVSHSQKSLLSNFAIQYSYIDITLSSTDPCTWAINRSNVVRQISWWPVAKKA